MKTAAVWGFVLAAAVVAGMQLATLSLALGPKWSQGGSSASQATTEPVQPLAAQPARQQIYLRAGEDGLFHANIRIGRHTMPTMIDTGADRVALRYRDARAAGLRLSPSDFNLIRATANGQAKFAVVTLPSVRIGHLVLTDIPAYVATPGTLPKSLLGMSVLSRMHRIDTRGRDLVLLR